MKVHVSEDVKRRDLQAGDVVCLDDVGYYLIRELNENGEQYELVGLSGNKLDYDTFPTMSALIKNIYKSHKVRVYSQEDYKFSIVRR